MFKARLKACSRPAAASQFRRTKERNNVARHQGQQIQDRLPPVAVTPPQPAHVLGGVPRPIEAHSEMQMLRQEAHPAKPMIIKPLCPAVTAPEVYAGLICTVSGFFRAVIPDLKPWRWRNLQPGAVRSGNKS